ncbi:uncharacterized protein [Miscanthus floridulus]|uniref:uncharacterized protein n=1 Tax=Miscanthus floridulus TaxID=154761 RepID=UPI0034589E9C
MMVAKGASHMVLADDSFSTIVSVVGEVKIYLQQHQSFHKVWESLLHPARATTLTIFAGTIGLFTFFRRCHFLITFAFLVSYIFNVDSQWYQHQPGMCSSFFCSFGSSGYMRLYINLLILSAFPLNILN